MIAIIDCGMGNVKAFAEVYKNLNVPAAIVKHSEGLKNARKLILPGVGAFDHAMQKLDESGMRPILNELVFQKRLPLLGVCVGMQMLGHSSEEGSLPGLGWIDGKVKRFDSSCSESAMRLPHMGWNNIKPLSTNGLLEGLDMNARFYFLHSYYFNSDRSKYIIAETDYNGKFASAVNSGNIFGVQFHPEKSHKWGIRLLENFAKI
jgi:glutamine amidotransferase